jgi:DNA-binding response OmpR family regulator
MTTTSVLIVEDDEKLGRLLQNYLQDEGFAVRLEPRGDRAADRIRAESPNLVILDLMLPGRDGLAICREIRAWYRGCILMLTARRAEVDQILGLELGADDYVTKPVDPRLLLARVRSLLRRARPEGLAPVVDDVAVGPLALDRRRRSCVVGDQAVDLTETEFNLLWALAVRVGDVVGREDLFRDVLGVPYDGLDRGVDVHMSRIRRKLEGAGFSGDRVRSVRGAGYLLAPP